jgi:Tol biopolymer transport system component
MSLFRRWAGVRRLRPKARALSLEPLEDRCLLSVQAVSLADPSLFATGAIGSSGPAGHSISADGRYAVFTAGDNIVPGDNNLASDVFVRDLQTGAVKAVSVTPEGTTGNAASYADAITPDGRYVLFSSAATNLVPGATAGQSNIYVRDLVAGTTTLVNVNSAGTGGSSQGAYDAVITPDGRYVAFLSDARDLVSGDTSVGGEIYRRDLISGTTVLVSSGQGTGSSFPYVATSGPQITDDGRYIVFQSAQTYSNATRNIYVRDVTDGTTALVSANSTENGGGNYDSSNAVIATGGRYVAFVSLATNLVAGLNPTGDQVYLRDLQQGTTSVVSIGYTGAAPNGASGVDGRGNPDTPSLSADGRYVAFTSEATNLTATASPALPNVFVRDMTAGQTTQVSVSNTGAEPNWYSEHPFISADGQSVAFLSFASNLTSQTDSGGGEDIFVRNLTAGTTTLVTVTADGKSATNANPTAPSITPDGSHVLFNSPSDALVTQDGDRNWDVFVRDLSAGTTTLVTIRDPGRPSLTANGNSYMQPITAHANAISSDGRYVAFTSDATNLVPGDKNNNLDVFVGDQTTGKVTLVSVNAAGTGSGNSFSQRPAMSADGRYVAFDSLASDLTTVPDTNGASDVFVRDLQTGTTTLVTINGAGTAAADGGGTQPVLSPNGRYVAFRSNASNLLPGRTITGYYNIYLRDLQTGTTTLVSAAADGTAGNGHSSNPVFTPDGRYVVFQSFASNLVPGDTNGQSDVFMHDLSTGTTTLVSVNQAGTGSGNGASQNPVISADGRYVAFESTASNLVANDTNGASDVFVRDLQTGTTTLVSVNQAGTASGGGGSQDASITPDGRYVAFDSTAPDLVANDTNGKSDVFVRDLQTGTTTLVSVNQAGTASGNYDSQYPQLSSDGRTVVFSSNAGDLVANDLNGSGTARTNTFLRNLDSGTTVILDNHPAGGYLLGSDYARSADGLHVAFTGAGDDLTAGDYNYFEDTFVWNDGSLTASGTTILPNTGSAFTGTVASFTDTDPSATATDFTATIDWGDGTSSTASGANGTIVTANGGFEVRGTHTYTADGTYALSVTITDVAGRQAQAASTAKVSGVATHFQVSAPANTTANTSFAVTVTALDASNQTALTYAGTVHFTSSDAAASLPADYTFTPTDLGVHPFTVTLRAGGIQTLTATDTQTSSVDGSATIMVGPEPVAAYNFAQGSGSVLTDVSGNGNNGTISNATWTTVNNSSVPFTSALQFAGGNNSFVTIANSASLDLTTGMTLEAWVDPTAAANGWQDVMYKYHDNYYLETSSPSGAPAAGGTAGSADTGPYAKNPLPTNTWSFLAATYDGTNMILYVNGVQVSNVPMSGNLATSTFPLQIGGDSIYGQYFQGLISNVRIYSTALTANEIQEDMNTPIAAGTPPPTTPANLTATASGPTINLTWGASSDILGVSYVVEREAPGSNSFVQIATTTGTSYFDNGLAPNSAYTYKVQAVDWAGNQSAFSNTASATTGAAIPGLMAAYNFAQGSGSVLTDLSGNSNNGTISNATWTTVTNSSLPFTGALQFAGGNNSFVTIANSPALEFSTGYTLEAWVDPTAAANGWQDVMYKARDNYYLEAASPSGAPAAGGTAGSADNGPSAKNPLPTNTWSFLAATYDGTTMILYVNGVPVASVAVSGNLATSTNPLQIGGDSFYGQYFQGLISNVRIYSTALTAAEIQEDMTTPIAAGTPPPTTPANLTATASGTSITLKWGASSDGAGVSYVVDREAPGSSTFVQIATTTGTSYFDNGLAPNSAYTYKVQAVDWAGNQSAFSNTASATTGAGIAGLMAAYNFAQGSGNVLTDQSGNGNNGTISNATWTTVSNSNLPFTGALQFAGGNSSFVTIADTPSLELSTGMTLEAWVDPMAAANGWQDVMYKYHDDYYLESSSPLGAPAAGGTAGTSDTGPSAKSPLPMNTWTFLAATYNGTSMILYVNGVQVASVAVSGNLATSTNPLQIGGDSFYGQYFQGLISNVRIYNKALSQSAIQTDMNTAI